MGPAINDKYAIVKRLTDLGDRARFLAEHRAIQRPVEVHRLPELSEDALARFRKLIRVQGASVHQSLQNIVDSGMDPDGRPFVVYDALYGRGLDDLLESGVRIPRERALRIIRQILTALSVLHGGGLVYRALAPKRVILVSLSRHELVKLQTPIWPGLVGELGPSIELESVYDRAYVAPEVLEGAVADPRADVFSVGRLLEELLGEHPLVTRATAADPGDRFVNAMEFLQVLQGRPSMSVPLPESDETSGVSLGADLMNLKERGSLHADPMAVTPRFGAPAFSDDITTPVLTLLLLIEATYQRFGQELWFQLVGRVPEVERFLPEAPGGRLNLEQRVERLLLQRVIEEVEALVGEGDLQLLIALGQSIGQRSASEFESPRGIGSILDRLAGRWNDYFGADGFVRMVEGQPRAQFWVTGQPVASLELTALMGGFLQGVIEGLEAVQELSIGLRTAQAVGDEADLFLLQWNVEGLAR